MLRLIPFATVGYTILIVFASLAKFIIPFFSSDIKYRDKFMHAIAYFGFTVIWTFFFYVRNDMEVPSKSDFKKAIYKAAIFGVLFGILMEFAQLILTNYRSFDVLDAFANSLGVLIASLIMHPLAYFFCSIKKSGV